MRFQSPRPGPRRATERTARRSFAAFLLLAAAAVAPAAAGWWDDAAEARESTIEQLRRSPAEWRDVPVLLHVRFGGIGERSNPYFTQFTPECWRSVHLLPRMAEATASRDAAHTQIVGATTTAAGELATAFVARGSRDDLRLEQINPNRAVRVRAVVRDSVAGEPWVEILSFTLDGDPLTPEEQTRVREADRFLEHRNAVAAERLYRAVLDSRELADADRAGLLRKLGVALHDQRRPQDALVAFREALSLDPDDLDARHRATHLEVALARTPLPRSDDGSPPTAGRAVRATPESPGPSDAPLLLPRRGPGLAPPSGLPTGDAGSEDATEQTEPAPGKDERDDEPAAKPPVADEPTPAEPESDTPPPVPKPPRLSGPK